MASFEDLMNEIHSQLSDTTDYSTNILEVNEKRIFNPIEMDTIIAYEGDINSQIITIKCPKTQDNHDLSGCAFKELKWKNLSSGVEGISKLKVVETQADKFYVTWEVPSDLCTQAGTIEISIQLYDKKDETVIFAWNTASYSGLSVAKSMDSVGFEFPAKNEILFIDKDTKNIVAPQGYNNVICNYGDVGVANVYFLINRYLGKNHDFDVYNDAKVVIYAIINGHRTKAVVVNPLIEETNINKRLYTTEFSDRNKEGLVLLNWQVPAEITAGEYGAHDLQISLEFSKRIGNTIEKRWFSNTYSGLKIGQSMIEIETEPGSTVINEDMIHEIIDGYFIVNDIVWDPN